jgi:hypothetical protein
MILGISLVKFALKIVMLGEPTYFLPRKISALDLPPNHFFGLRLLDFTLMISYNWEMI